MRNSMLFIFSALFLSPVYAGQFVQKTMYVPHSVAQGIGEDEASAKKDALKAIPENYSVDLGNSPAVECLQNKHIESMKECQSQVLITIPLLRNVERIPYCSKVDVSKVSRCIDDSPYMNMKVEEFELLE